MSRLIFLNRVCWPQEEATAQLLVNLADQLSSLGWSCHVVTSSPVSEGQESAYPALTMHRIAPGSSERALNLISKAMRYWRFTRACRKFLRGFIREGDVIVAMTDPPLIGEGVASVTRQKGALLWHWVQDVYPEVAVALTHNPIVTFMLGRKTKHRNTAWRQAEQIIAIGDDMADLIHSQVNAATPVKVIPNWYPETAASTVTEDFRSRWGFKEDDLVVTYSGNLGRAHDLHSILELAKLCQTEHRIRFSFVGSGAQRPGLEEAVQTQKLSNVSFHPPVHRKELDSLLGSADIHLVTMREECLGTVVPSKFYGIVHANRPALFIGPPSSDIAREIRAHGLGAAVTKSDLKPAAAYLRSLLGNRESLLRAKSAVKEYASQLPSAQTTARLWDNLLRERGHQPSSSTG